MSNNKFRLPRTEAAFDKANRFILEHPIVSVVLWALIWQAVTVGGAPAVPKGPMHFTLMAWIALAALPYVAVVTVLLPRVMRRSARDTVSLRWTFAQAAWLLALVAAFTGGPQWIFGVGSIECLILMLLALREARREWRSPAADNGGVAATE